MPSLTLLWLVIGSAMLGAAVGLLAGLVPGFHVNNLAQVAMGWRLTFVAWLAAAVGLSGGANSAEAAAPACGFLFGAALGHSFTDEIPAVFLGAPDPDTALSVLPGHRLLMAGLGGEAVRAAALGSAMGVLLSLPLVPALAWIMGAPLHLYAAAAPVIPLLLIAAAVALIASEQGRPTADLSRRRARLLASGVLLASGALGEWVMFEGLPFERPSAPFGGIGALHLLSLFAGLFGLPTLLLAALAKPADTGGAPEPRPLALAAGHTARVAAIGTGAGALVGWLPGVGAAQAAILATGVRDAIARRRGPRENRRDSPQDAAEFLVMQAAAGAANLMFTVVALFALLRTRSGTMAAVETFAGPTVEAWDRPFAAPDLLVALLVAAVICLPFCYAGSLALGRGCVGFYSRMEPRKLSAAVFVAVVALVFVLEGFWGLVVIATALPLGLLPPLAGIKRVHLMGAVLVPIALRLATS